jgi:hypothetical protein
MLYRLWLKGGVMFSLDKKRNWFEVSLNKVFPEEEVVRALAQVYQVSPTQIYVQSIFTMKPNASPKDDDRIMVRLGDYGGDFPFYIEATVIHPTLQGMGGLPAMSEFCELLGCRGCAGGLAYDVTNYDPYYKVHIRGKNDYQLMDIEFVSVEGKDQIKVVAYLEKLEWSEDE